MLGGVQVFVLRHIFALLEPIHAMHKAKIAAAQAFIRAMS
jgi:hypothetical protein